MAQPQQEDRIVIHVCDEIRKINRDFTCSRSVLVKEMRYFSRYLDSAGAYDDIDISVHCDVHIFEWLVNYIHHPASPPTLDAASVVSILISSDFLGMDRLVKQCMSFVVEHVNEIVRMPIDLTCLNRKLLDKLAGIITDAQLGGIVDRRDKIESKLAVRKLQRLLERRPLLRCRACGLVFAAEHLHQLRCDQSDLQVDFRGNVLARHEPAGVKEWDPLEWLQERLQAGDTWSDVFWRVWGCAHVVYCTVCRYHVTAAQFLHCSFHPEPCLFPPSFGATPSTADIRAMSHGPHVGVYPCCGQPTPRFDAFARIVGCDARPHTPRATRKEEKDVVATLEAYKDRICTPFPRRASTGTGAAAAGQVGAAGGRAAAAGKSAGSSNKAMPASSATKQTPTFNAASRYARGLELTGARQWMVHNDRRWQIPDAYRADRRKRRQWRLDMRRADDVERMRDLVQNLVKQRK